MDFSTAILTCFSKYATFTGRARRSEFWWFVLFNLVVMAVLNFIDLGFGNPARWMMGEGRPSPVASLCWLAVILPSLAVTVRRLHDTDRSGWWVLIQIIPVIGPLLLIWFLATEGTSGTNRFGPDPLDRSGGWGESAESSVPRVPRR
ncbi:MAG: DUF805 domain-containing protein [Rhodobacteraceae bacterium]|nr:DUF805 domain-containing protein [Paracoccaceae bacterium]